MQDVYLDNAATTKVDDSIADIARDIMLSRYGNPSSLHSKGLEAQHEMEKASANIQKALGVNTGKVIFTSGGTEANNLAIFGTVNARKRLGNRIVTTEIEHPSVLEAVKELEKQGFEIKIVPADNEGRFCAEKFIEACDENTILATAILVNNETGVIQPVEAVSKEIRRKSPNAVIHTDAVQAFGKMAVSPKALGVDMVSVSGHKIHAPKGIGALYILKNTRILPMLFGGGQQDSLRPGTENVPLSAAFGAAAKEAFENIENNSAKAQLIKASLLKRLQSVKNVFINSPEENCLPYILNISADGLNSETVIHFMAERGIFISGGSACSKGKKSHVLKAMSLSDRRISSALRISLSKYTTEDDVRYLCEILALAEQNLKKF